LKKLFRLPAISSLLCIATTLLFSLRPDSFAAITFLPAWIWLTIGLILALPSLRAKRKYAFAVVLLMWTGYTFAFVEEPFSLMRRPGVSSVEIHRAREAGKAVRLVTLNCASGSFAAASEVKKYRPDIVLLQESPSRSDISRLARELYGKSGSFAYGPDASIIARGKLQAFRQLSFESSIYTAASVILRSGFKANVVSLRLVPPVFRLDLWSPNCWRSQKENRQERREQIKLIAAKIRQFPKDVPVIIGGDFNAPAGDAVFRLLEPRLHDTFTEGGLGWGNTVLNETPVQRIDQIWASSNIKAACVRAYRTRNSDHRLVACDLQLNCLYAPPAVPILRP